MTIGTSCNAPMFSYVKKIVTYFAIYTPILCASIPEEVVVDGKNLRATQPGAASSPTPDERRVDGQSI